MTMIDPDRAGAPRARLAALLLTLALISVVLPAAAQTTLRYSDHEPLGNMRTRFIDEQFLAALERESKGRIKVARHWNSEVSTGYDALKAVGADGKAELAVVVPEYAAAALPLHQLFKSFPTGPSGERQVEFLQKAYRDIPELDAELAKSNLVRVFIATGYPVGFFSPRKLDTLDDVRGGSWRSASFWHQAQLRAVGATPVSVPWGQEVTSRLAAGTLDGLMVNIDSARDIRAHEVARNALVARELWLGHVYLVAMNRDRWNALSKADQAAFRRAAKSASATLGPTMDASFDEMVAILRADGLNLRLLSPAELQGWTATSDYRAEQMRWSAEQEKQGVARVRPVLERLTRLWQRATER